MAQNTFVSLTVPASGDPKDGNPHHDSAASGDISISYDNTKITTITKMRSAVRQLLQMAESNSSLGK